MTRVFTDALIDKTLHKRISEILSDIVESQSGYIDIGFDVPSGGAFRVLDVIVTEAPRFSPAN